MMSMLTAQHLITFRENFTLQIIKMSNTLIRINTLKMKCGQTIEIKKMDRNSSLNQTLLYVRVSFLAHQIRIFAFFTCAYKSYLTHVISPWIG